MLLVLFLLSGVNSYKFPGSCDSGQFFEPSLMDCLACPANASLVTSADGFGCSCEEHSIPVDVARCKPCNITEVVASDGSMCVPRRCQSSAGRISCRKCPNDYISVTQNFDGSPMKEVQCIKCARGYKAIDNRCVRCEACSCRKHEIIVRGKCIPKKYISKYTENYLHPYEFLEIVKLEYLCSQQDFRACRRLASYCVRNFYSSETAGPCRLWIQPNLVKFKGLPLLTIDSSKYSSNIAMEQDEGALKIITMKHTNDGGLKIIQLPAEFLKLCLPPIIVKIGEDRTYECVRNVSEISSQEYSDIYELYISNKTDIHPLIVSIRKPNGYYVQKGAWASECYRKFFFINNYLSTTTNTTNTDYLQTLILRINVERDTSKLGMLQIKLTVEAQYTSKSSHDEVIITSLRIEHEMPYAGVLRGLEISGGILGVFFVLYGLVKWHGVVRRGGHYIAVVPLVFSSMADSLYFATFFSTLHALTAEAGTLGLTLPLSQIEERVIQALVYTVLSLKCVKLIWINWKQCCCDIFFIEWDRYNPSFEEALVEDKPRTWKVEMLAKEWMSWQTKRRVSPGYTISLTILILYFSASWLPYIPKCRGYKWVISAAAWWCSYVILYCMNILHDRFFETPFTPLVKVCNNFELSLLVFQEEYYAYYVNGRNEYSTDFTSLTHSLSSCRIVCAPKLRTVYKKLTTAGGMNADDNHHLLSKFLAAFFERALNGLNWVASERTVLERLFDVEFVAREGGSTSVLLYDANVGTPSCCSVTWWGEEWTLATFDAMLFGCVLMATDQTLLAAFITAVIWKIMKFGRTSFGNINVQRKIHLKT